MADEEIVVDPMETVPLTSDQDSSLDPLNTGFTWYKPAKTLQKGHRTGAHTWTISGHDMQILTSTVPAGEEIVTEVGSMVFMHPNMETNVELTLCSSLGCSEGCRRICGGESCVKVILKNPSNQEGYVGLTPNYPAKVVPVKFGVNVKSGSALIAQGGSYMTHIGDVDVGCSFDCNCLRCCCGGFGVCRQKLTGSDDSIAFLSAGGTIVYRQLKSGETVIVDSQSILAYDETVQIGLSLNGRLCTCCCGGEGIFSTTLTGPGQIWMQSSNFQKFTDAVQQTVVEDDKMDRGGANDSI